MRGPDGVVVLLNGEFLEGALEATAEHVRVPGIDHIVLLAVHKEGRHPAVTNVGKFDVKRIELELRAVLLGHLESEGDHELWGLDVFVGYLEGNHFEGEESGVDYLEHHILGLVLEAVEEGGSGPHRPPPQHEPLEAHPSQIIERAIST